MRMNDTSELDFEYGEEPSGFGLAVALVLVLVLLVGAFVWFVVQFEPLTDDFIDNDTPIATATVPADEI